jgi:hypothetical protein
MREETAGLAIKRKNILYLQKSFKAQIGTKGFKESLVYKNDDRFSIENIFESCLTFFK